MSKITFFIPYPEIGKIIEEIFQEQNDDGWELEIILANYVREIAERKGVNTDAIIARGVTAVAAKIFFKSTCVVELPVSGYDILRAVKVCQKRFAATKIGVVGSRDMIYGVKSIEDIMDIKLVVVEVHDEVEAEPSIRDLKECGVDAVIGGVMSTQIAEQLGFKAVYIQIGREAIYHSLREAKRMVQVRREEQEHGEQFRAILDYSAEGIVAVDSTGNISLFNAAAGKLTALHKDAVGLSIEELFPELGLNLVLTSGNAGLGEIQTINGQQMAINKVPIIVGNRTAGAVATFQPVVAIQELEGKIRRKIHQRGHVAKLVFSDILGESQAISRTIATAKEFSEVNSNVLIMGETGTGKEIFAQSIHNASLRRNGPFVAVNCAALPENLLESELFGYTEGAFTGASRGGKMGLFELAHLGTIFLDEISEIPSKLQGRLLRVVQEQEIMRLGDDRVIPVNVRIIAATNRNLYNMMQEGLFREDLYYRMDILRLVLPSLRERPEDIMLLMNHFLKLYCQRLAKPFQAISQEVCQLLNHYFWPGNVRELRNVAERLMVLGKNGVIQASEVEGVLSHLPIQKENSHSSAAEKTTAKPIEHGDANLSVLLKVLEESNYHYGKAATALGMSRITLWRRLKEYDRLKT